MSNTPITAEILAVWTSGRKVEAIKLLREHSGLGLAEAKALLESTDEADLPAWDDAAPAPVEQQIAAAIARGNKLQAVQLLKEFTGIGLAQAKQRVEDAMDGEPLDLSPAPETPSHIQPAPVAQASGSTSPGEVPRSSQWLWVAVLVAAVVLGAWFYLKK